MPVQVGGLLGGPKGMLAPPLKLLGGAWPPCPPPPLPTPMSLTHLLFQIPFQFIFVFTFVDYEASTYGKYLYPGWADALGWILACVVIAPIFIGMGYRLYEEDEIHHPIDVS